jgi:hypothetical protein
MAQENLVHSPLFPVVGDAVVLLGVLGEAMSSLVSRGSWIKLHKLGREGNQLVGCPSFSHSAQRGLTRGGSGAMGYFFFHLPPDVTVVLESGGEGGVVGVRTGIYIDIPSI